MGPKDDGQPAVAFEVEVRVVALLLGQGGDLAKELDPGHEVLHGPGAADSAGIRIECPTFKAEEGGLGLIARDSRDSSFAGSTSLAN
jgi:hypothetical protein